ncbi:hypothetical protein Ancab_012592 [Ancistrocladus abbreviatus]
MDLPTRASSTYATTACTNTYANIAPIPSSIVHAPIAASIAYVATALMLRPTSLMPNLAITGSLAINHLIDEVE